MRQKAKDLQDGLRYQRRAIKVSLYPTDEQKEYFAKCFGCVRYYWNNALADEKELYECAAGHFILPVSVYKTKALFLKEIDSLALANAKINLESAFKAFFEGRSGFPKFKSKKAKQSYTTNCQYSGAHPTIEVFKDGVKLPKIGKVKAVVHRQPMIGWTLKSATVSKTPCGNYFCSLLYEYIEKIPAPVAPTEEKTIGFDYSLPYFYVDNNNKIPEYTKWYRETENKLAHEQHKLSRMVQGSKNYEEQQNKIAELHAHIANQRKDFTHKLSTQIANEYDVVCVEDIALQNMAKALNYGKSVNDSGFGMFRDQLKYKLDSRGKHYVVIDKWYPSSKLCHNCDYKNKDLRRGDRQWDCPVCGKHLLRDHNAAINIKNEGLRLLMENINLRAA